jgi:hypothetical protein
VYARHRLYLSLVDVALALLGCIRAGRRDELEPEILVAGFAAVLAVNTMNPDALIARTTSNARGTAKSWTPATSPP